MKVENNDLVMGASGRIGNMLVFRQRAGRTIISKRPKKKSTPDSEGQIAVRETFSEAVLYAKAVINDETKKAVYQLKATSGVSAYNLALADYCKAPEIKKADVSAYTGTPGNIINIRAIDDFMVKSVRVAILDAGETLIEEGEAILADNNIDWVYTVTTANPAPQNSIVRVVASDLPGNKTQNDFLI